ncbi:MAG: HAMP domain-containing protein, partial [Caldilineaceae bacterium]|nr:HAMP domain-containing protein [Caldilineaceae bacterium]
MADKIALPREDLLHWKHYQTIYQMLSAPKIRWRTAFTYALIIVLLMGSLALYLSIRITRWYTAQAYGVWQALSSRLAADPALIATLVAATGDTTAVDSDKAQRLAALFEERATLLNARLTVYAPDGSVLADSHLNASALTAVPSISASSLLSDSRSLVIAAEQGDAFQQIDDELLGGSVLLFTRPLTDAGVVIGYLRLSFLDRDYWAAAAQIRWWIVPMIGVVTLLIIAMMVFQAERAAYTLRRLTTVAEQITAGDLSARTLSLSGGEVGQFVRAFNRMADKLQR